MSTYLSSITDRIAKVSIIFGIAFLLVSVALSLALIPGAAATVNGQGNCGEGYVAKVEPGPFTYTHDEVITWVYVKSSTECFLLTTSNPSNACYQATGLGTNSVTVTKIGPSEGNECKDISHVEFYSDPTDPPVTETPVTETPVTETPVTETPVTETPVTETPVTETPVTETPVTETPVTETPVTTDPPTTTTPTEEIRTPTPPPTLPQPTSSSGTQQVLIPQTGVDLSNRDSGIGFWMILFMGLGLVGAGLIFQNVSNQLNRRK